MKQATARAMQLLIAYLAFISIGLPDSVAGVAWPSVRETFDLRQSSLGLVFIGLGTGYFASSFFGGWLTQRLGLARLLIVSSLLVAVAMFTNSIAPAWPVFVGSAVVWGLGSGAIDAGLNAYVSSHYSTRQVNWLHACYSLGATLGPLIMTAALVRLGSWQAGYVVVGGLLLAMTATFAFSRRQWDQPAGAENAAGSAAVGMTTVLRHPLVWLQVIAFFLYTGLEISVGQWAYTVLTESRGFATGIAGVLVGVYFGAIGVGRVLLGAIADRMGVDRLLRICMLSAVVGTLLFAIPAAISSVLGLVLLGLGLAPVFPCLMARTPERLGSAYAVHAIGFQVSAAMLGAAIVPGIAGLLAETQIELVGRFAIVIAAALLITHEGLLWYAARPEFAGQKPLVPRG